MALDQVPSPGAASESPNDLRDSLINGLFGHPKTNVLSVAEKQTSMRSDNQTSSVLGEKVSEAALSTVRNPQIAVFALDQLDPVTQQRLASAQGPAVIEFIDRNDNSAECKAAPIAFSQADSQLEGQVTFISAYNDQQSPQMLEQNRVAVCPTYFFVFDKQDHNEIVAKRIWGYLSADQLESVAQEMWNVKPRK